MFFRKPLLVLSCAVPLALLSACYAPTLSKPRGKAHLDALAAAESHQHHGRYEEAAASYLRAADAAERRVDRDESLYRQSRVLARMGEYERAIAVCDQLGASEVIARRTLRARLDAARYRLRTGEEERAYRDLRALAVEHPDSAAASGAVRTLVSVHVDGVADKEQGLAWLAQLEQEVTPSSVGEVLMTAQAELLAELGRRPEAIRVLRAQVERYPYPQGARWEEALSRLADLALDQGDPQQAIDYLKKMVSVHERSFIVGSYTRPKFPRAALRIARIYRDELSDPLAAIAAYREVRSEFPRSRVVDDALAEEAELQLARGEQEEGCDLLREVTETFEVGAARRRAEARMARDCR